MDLNPCEPKYSYTLQRTLETPAHVSCLSFGHTGHLFAGSDDGSVRVYDLSTFKVLKAIRGLDSEVSSVICLKRPGSELRDAWLACGKRAMKFQMDSPKMVQTADDALTTIELGESDDDILNELAINSNRTHLAFCMDSGVVGVIDLTTTAATRMKTKHKSVCGSVKFIPNRPREIVSGGYDTALLHFDFLQGAILSTREMPIYNVVGGMALSPPFVMSTAISPTGIMAAGTADGRLWLGMGGHKPHPSTSQKKKRTRKWEGLDDDHDVVIEMAKGPIVAMAFDEIDTLTLSTLMGLMMSFCLTVDTEMGSVGLDKIWHQQTRSIQKVNALIVDRKQIIVGGFKDGGKGSIELWKRGTN